MERNTSVESMDLSQLNPVFDQTKINQIQEYSTFGKGKSAEEYVLDVFNKRLNLRLKDVSTQPGNMDLYDEAKKIRIEVKCKKDERIWCSDTKFMENMSHFPNDKFFIYVNLLSKNFLIIKNNYAIISGRNFVERDLAILKMNLDLILTPTKFKRNSLVMNIHGGTKEISNIESQSNENILKHIIEISKKINEIHHNQLIMMNDINVQINENDPSSLNINLSSTEISSSEPQRMSIEAQTNDIQSINENEKQDQVLLNEPVKISPEMEEFMKRVPKPDDLEIEYYLAVMKYIKERVPERNPNDSISLYFENEIVKHVKELLTKQCKKTDFRNWVLADYTVRLPQKIQSYYDIYGLLSNNGGERKLYIIIPNIKPPSSKPEIINMEEKDRSKGFVIDDIETLEPVQMTETNIKGNTRWTPIGCLNIVRVFKQWRQSHQEIDTNGNLTPLTKENSNVNITDPILLTLYQQKYPDEEMFVLNLYECKFYIKEPARHYKTLSGYVTKALEEEEIPMECIIDSSTDNKFINGFVKMIKWSVENNKRFSDVRFMTTHPKSRALNLWTSLKYCRCSSEQDRKPSYSKIYNNLSGVYDGIKEIIPIIAEKQLAIRNYDGKIDDCMNAFNFH